MAALVAFLARRFGISDLAASLGAIGLALVVLGGGVGLHQWYASAALAAARTEGEMSERRLWEVAAAKERDRREDLAREAEARGAAVAAALRIERDDLAARLEEMDHDALADPDRDRCGLGIGGVLRLDAIR